MNVKWGWFNISRAGKLAWFWVEPGHLEKQAETVRVCLGGMYDYCLESPKKSDGGDSKMAD